MHWYWLIALDGDRLSYEMRAWMSPREAESRNIGLRLKHEHSRWIPEAAFLGAALALFAKIDDKKTVGRENFS